MKNSKEIKIWSRLFYLFILLVFSHLLIYPNIVTAAGDSAELIHKYDFNDNLLDSLPTGISLHEYPTTATSSFNDSTWEWTADSYADGGEPGGGLILETELITDPENYSLGFRISYDDVDNYGYGGRENGYVKIISFKGLDDDNGLYFYEGYLEFYPYGTQSINDYETDTFYDFIFTRGIEDNGGQDTGIIRLYIVEDDGDTVTKVFEEWDPDDNSVPEDFGDGYQFAFFMDDTYTTDEYTTGGAVKTIRVWNGVLDPEDLRDALSDVQTGSATLISTDSATLNGEVDPHGIENNTYFDYGLTSSYGTRVESDQSPITDATDVSKAISGLEANKTYHFRVVAVNTETSTEVYGADKTFTTLDVPPPTVTSSFPVDGAKIHSVNTLYVDFSEDMVHDGSTNAANNINNYLLVEANGDGFQTETCAGGVAGNDTRIIIIEATYDNNSGDGPYRATLTVPSLPVGSYLLLACGTATIYDLDGVALNGGRDSAITFRVATASNNGSSPKDLTPDMIKSLPGSGFAPDQETTLPIQPLEKQYKEFDNLKLEIPALGIKSDIVGVPQTEDGWDLSWLSSEVGWLQGTAFPTWAGNSALTAHVYDVQWKARGCSLTWLT